MKRNSTALAGKCGMQERARARLEAFRSLARKRYVTSYGVALIHAGLGDTTETLLWLRKAFEERSHCGEWCGWSSIHVLPISAPIRNLSSWIERLSPTIDRVAAAGGTPFKASDNVR